MRKSGKRETERLFFFSCLPDFLIQIAWVAAAPDAARIHAHLLIGASCRAARRVQMGFMSVWSFGEGLLP
jgi:hypothetical protein